MMRIALMVCVSVLLLVLTEGVLRLAGYGHPTSFFVASPHQKDGALIENRRFAWRFPPPLTARALQPTRIRRENDSRTIRVFVFGTFFLLFLFLLMPLGLVLSLFGKDLLKTRKWPGAAAPY